MFFDWPICLPASARRARKAIPLFLALFAPTLAEDRCLANADAGPDLNGTWKLVAQNQELAIFEIKHADGKTTVEIIDGLSIFSKPRIYLETSPDPVVILFAYDQGDITFRGHRDKGGGGGHLVGVSQLRASGMITTFRAILERTGSKKVAETREPQVQPGGMGAIGMLLETRKAVAELLEDRYKALDVRAAAAAVGGLPIDATTTARAWAVSRLVDAAKRAGTPDVAAETSLAGIKALIAAENRPTPLPLVVEPSVGRRDPDGDRVVLMELFTGAQCGACVAADVAFDALTTAYKHVDLITLQYHLHIPGPDPLTSPDSVSRQAYYGVRGTPSTYFNGRALAGGGGAGGDSRKKFHQYRHVIDELRKVRREATLDLVALRTGDEIRIEASAKVDSRSGVLAKNLRLRLALVEVSVPYAGSNGQLSHHYVVRTMPGGAEGKAIQGGSIRIEETIKLGDIRVAQEAYLKGYPGSPESRGSFPTALPPVALKKLLAAAFIQDDGDRTVLDAIIVPVD